LSDSLNLRLIWKGESEKRPAADFACALISHLFDSRQIATVHLSNDIYIEGLNLEECVGVLREQNEAELIFNPEFLRERKNSNWRLCVEIKETDNDGGTQKVNFKFPGDPDGSGTMSQFPVALWWMDADQDYLSPFRTIALPHSHSNIHAWALNGLVGLANKFGQFDSAELYSAKNKRDESLVARWYPQKPSDVSKESISPVVSVSNESLWLPVHGDHGEIKEIQLWYENKYEPDQPETLWQDLRNQLAIVAQSDPRDILAFQTVLNKFNSPFGNIEIKEIQSIEHAQFMATPQEGTILLLAPEKDRIVFGINFEKASHNISEIVLHGLGHVALGHVQLNDEYSHSDTIDSVMGIGSLKRWV